MNAHLFARRIAMTAGIGAAALGGGVGVVACNGILGFDKLQPGGCKKEGERRCRENTPEVCQAGQWNSHSPCEVGICQMGTCGQCEEGSRRCARGMPQACSDDAQCPSGQSCIAGQCKPCTADTQCGVGGKGSAGRCPREPASGVPQRYG